MDSPDSLRLLIVPGVSPGRWVSTWKDRYALPIEVEVVAAAEIEARLVAGDGDAAFVRLPLGEPVDGAASDPLAVIPLWIEQSVVVVARENELSLLAEVSPADLAEETFITADDDVLGWAELPGAPFTGPRPATAGDAVELVAAEAGVLVLPASIARAHTRKDVAVVPLLDGPTSQVGLAWRPVDGSPAPAVDDLIGVVRGRTANSSRGRTDEEPAVPLRPTEKAKAAARAARAAAARGAGAKGAARGRAGGRAAGGKGAGGSRSGGARRRGGR